MLKNGLEVFYILLSCKVIVKPQMMGCVLSFFDDSTELHDGWIPTCGYEDCIVEFLLILIGQLTLGACKYLIESHCIIAAFEP